MSDSLHRQQYDATARSPLHGIRVVDLSRLVAGNMITHFLADFGAEVIKVEHPATGDDLRNWKIEDVPTYWKVYARNKKSLTLNYRSDEGRRILAELVRTADMLVENFPPGRMESYGLGPDWLLQLNERLIVVRVSGWGQDGPFSHKPGFGSLVEAMSGFSAMNGFPDRPPLLPPLALADMVAGMYGASAAMVALREVEVNGGKGQVVDLSLFEPMLAILGPQAANYRLTGKVPARMGSRSPTAVPRNVYPCSDGLYIAISASTQPMTEKLFRSIGRPELITDPRFATNSDRLVHDDELDAIIADFIRAHTQAEIIALFDRAGVTAGAVCSARELMEHPYIRERECFVTTPDEDIGELPMHNITPRLSGTPGSLRSPAPRLGEHTQELLAELGLAASEIDEYRQRKII